MLFFFFFIIFCFFFVFYLIVWLRLLRSYRLISNYVKWTNVYVGPVFVRVIIFIWTTVWGNDIIFPFPLFFYKRFFATRYSYMNVCCCSYRLHRACAHSTAYCVYIGGQYSFLTLLKFTLFWFHSSLSLYVVAVYGCGFLFAFALWMCWYLWAIDHIMHEHDIVLFDDARSK